MEFVLPLNPPEGAANRRATTLHLLLAIALGSLGISCLLLYWFTAKAGVFQTAYWYKSLPDTYKTANGWFAIFGAVTILASVAIAVIATRFRKWLLVGRRNVLLRSLETLMLIAACLLFITVGQKFPAAIFGALALWIGILTAWEMKPVPPPEALISEKGVRIPNGKVQKTYSWKEVEAVLLRHGILSVELSGNRLVQRYLKTDTDTDAAAVEAFCRPLIDQYAAQRAATNAW